MNRSSVNENNAVLAAQHEAVKEFRSALDRILVNFERELERKPTAGEIEAIIQKALEEMRVENPYGQPESRRLQCPCQDGENYEREYSCLADKPCTCTISSFEAATLIADQIVRGNRRCRFISGEMYVENDGETITLTEELLLSDGTRILGRSFTFDNNNEAVDAVAKILWESAKLHGESSAMISSES